MWKKAVLTVIFLLFLYTRLTGLNWGLPYPLHPDERNMADAITRLECKSIAELSSCFNPQFFAYGQVPLYAAYAGIALFHTALGIRAPLSFDEAVLALRIISVLSSLATAYVLLRLTRHVIDLTGGKNHLIKHYGPWLSVFIFLFSPYGIQFAHFGTTESLLMLLYTVITYLTLGLLEKNSDKMIHLRLGVALGLATAVKVSSLIFLGLPLAALLFVFIKHQTKRQATFRTAILILGLTFITAVVLSPQTIISWKDFVSSFTYESSVGTGSYLAFYTRQFIGTIPVLFQVEKIFPYALGLAAFVIASLGFFLLSWKETQLNFLRVAFVVYFLPTAFLFAKWSRFMAPIFPLMTIFEAVFILWLLNRFRRRLIRVAVGAVFIASLLPGIAYMSVYANPDIRFTASEWMYSHIPSGSKILADAGNVIDIPVPPPGYDKTIPSYQYAAFDFYHLDESQNLQTQLRQFVKEADYILVPSRRVFMNHPAPPFLQTATYYHDLFYGQLGFEKIKKFTAYPTISLFGHTLVEFPDEQAEETWTVFDHPVVRLFQKSANPVFKPDFSVYDHTTFSINGKTYRLLVADRQQGWEQGLMWVRSKKDAAGYDGMIFLFPQKQIQTFWNKNTVADLDLYWIDGQKVVGKTQLPSIEKSKQIVTVTSPKEADKVIEIIR